MKSMRFSVCLESAICSSPDDCFYQSQSILPGSILRGALAQLYLQVRGKDKDFEEIFIYSENRFPFLFPASRTKEPMLRAPKTTVACKRGGKEHSASFSSKVEDLGKSVPPAQCKHPNLGKMCGADLKTWDGYLTSEALPLEKYYVGHTAIHPETNTAFPHAYFQEFLLQSKIGMEEGPHLSGYGWLSEKSYSILQRLTEKETVMLGKSRSRGKGWAKLTIEERQPEVRRENLLEKNHFTLHCVTPVILLDKLLCPEIKPTLSWRGESPQPLPSKTQSSMTKIAGWSMVHGLPKVEDAAIEIGSVFVYEKSGALQDDKNFLRFIEEMEQKGLGERKIEGFGQIKINDLAVVKPQEVK